MSDVIVDYLVLLAFLGVVGMVVLIPERLARQRIKADLGRRECVLVSIEEADNAFYWLLSRERIWLVRYYDRTGLLHEADCQTSVINGTYWKDDQIVS